MTQEIRTGQDNNKRNQEQETTTTRTMSLDSFEQWLNAPSPSFNADWFHLEPNETQILNFHLEKDEPPQIVEREFLDRANPSAPPKAVKRVVFRVSTEDEPLRIRTWEVSRTTATSLYPLLKKGFKKLECTRRGSSIDTSYNFVPAT